MTGQSKNVCPHLGLMQDEATHMNFPTLANHCLNCKRPASPNLEHQNEYCLTSRHEECVIYKAGHKISMPDEIGVVSTGFNILKIIPMLVILVLGGIYYLLPKPVVPVTAPEIPAISSPTLAEIKLPLPTSTSRPVIVSTDTPEIEQVPAVTPQHIYEATRLPAGSTSGFLVHIVLHGETLDTIASNYSTTVEAIMAVNYELDPPIWVDAPLVIPVGQQGLGASVAFEVYVVEGFETISSNALADILSIDAADLETYNACGTNCQFNKGNVLLIPHKR